MPQPVAEAGNIAKFVFTQLTESHRPIWKRTPLRETSMEDKDATMTFIQAYPGETVPDDRLLSLDQLQDVSLTVEQHAGDVIAFVVQPTFLEQMEELISRHQPR